MGGILQVSLTQIKRLPTGSLNVTLLRSEGREMSHVRKEKVERGAMS
jgi:hypothetical protein